MSVSKADTRDKGLALLPGEECVLLLDHGFVRLDNCMADDLSVVNSARVSFKAQREQMLDGDAGLIRFLMKNRHGTPFEHNAFRFHVKCPIFIQREWMRHRIGSFNEQSGRYTQYDREFYIPEGKNVRQRVGKPGNYSYEPAGEDVALYYSHALELECERAFDYYEAMLARGIAPEQARMILPVNLYTQFYWTVNARSLMNFLNLRNHETAMWEIQRYAKAVEWFFSLHMPVTTKAFIDNGRISP